MSEVQPKGQMLHAETVRRSTGCVMLWGFPHPLLLAHQESLQAASLPEKVLGFLSCFSLEQNFSVPFFPLNHKWEGHKCKKVYSASISLFSNI